MQPRDAIYLDHNAGAPLRPAAREAAMAALGAGNPSSVHGAGRQARAIVEAAREQVAGLVGATAKGVTFVSGGTEGNATVLSSRLSRGGEDVAVERLFVGTTEHPSVLSGGRFPRDAVTEIPVDGVGVVDLAALEALLTESAGRGETALVSVMHANNETGAIQPVARIASLAAGYGAFVHTDAAQTVGRIPVEIETLGVDFLTMSGHKLGGPQGTGAIVRRSEDVDFAPLLTGGGQESRKRAGTENVPAIAGFGVAAKAAAADIARATEWAGWRDRLASAITADLGALAFSDGAERLPQTLCIGIAGLSAETLVIGLDLEGVAVSSGSACSSGKVGPSHVLAAMGVPGKLARSAVRISFGWDTEEKDLDRFQNALRDVVGRISAAKGDRAA